MNCSMFRNFRMAGLMALCLLLLAGAEAKYKLVQKPLKDDPMGVHIYELDNGLTVYLSANPQEPQFFAGIGVRAGSKNDPADATGLAHYFEHLMFKGTQRMGALDYEKEKPYLDMIEALYEQHFAVTDPEKRKAIYAEINRVAQEAAQFAAPNEMDKLYSAMGSTYVNAHTWLEETVFKTGLPSNRLRQWAAVESERFHNPVMRLFHTELETVYEEKNRSLDNKERVIFYAVEEALYKAHPYKQPTLGTIEHLKSPSITKIQNFFDTWYAANNMCIAISGDIDIEETIQIIDAEFSKWEKKKLPKQKFAKEPKIKGVERVTVTFPGEEKVLLAFRTVAFDHKDRPVLELIDMILDNSTAGMINLNLVQSQKVRAAGAYPLIYNDYGAQYLWGIPKQGQTLEEVEALLLEQLELLKSGTIEDWLIPAIITDFKKKQKQELESNDQRSGRMIESFIRRESWKHNVETIERMEKISKKDVQRVARKYFGGDYIVGERRDGPSNVPQIDKPQIDKIEIDPTRQSAFAREVLAMTVEPIEPKFVVKGEDYSIHEYAKGVPMYVAANPVNDLFTLTFSVDKGFDQENLMRVADQLLGKSGTPEFDSIEITKEWYKLGTEYSMSVGDDETRISISGLDENLEPSLKLLMDLLKSPTADKATLDELVKIILAQRDDSKKDPASIHRALMIYNRIGEDSEFLKNPPTEKLKSLTVDELHAITKGLLEHEHTIEYTGSKSVGDVAAILKKYHPVSGALKPAPAYHRESIRKPEKSEILFFNKETAQSQIRLEFASGTVDEAMMPAVELFNDYFGGGMSSVVFQEIREARGLAYSAGAYFAAGERQGDENLMLGAMGTQVDKTPEATKTFLELLANMPLSDERFAITRDTLENQYRTGRVKFRGVIGAARQWERLGLAGDPRPGRFAAIQMAEIEMLKEFQKEQIVDRPIMISILGDKTKIDMKALEAMAPIKEVGIEDIFVE